MQYKVYFLSSILFALGVLFFIVSQVCETPKILVEVQGTIAVSKKRSGGARSDTKYFQKMENYKATFVNEISGISTIFIPNKLAKIYQDPEVREISTVYWTNPRLIDASQRKGSLFIFKRDLSKIDQNKELNYFYVRLQDEKFSKYAFYSGILEYVLKEQLGVVSIFMLLFSNLGLMILAAPGYEKPEDKWVFKTFVSIMIFYVLIFMY